MFMHHLFAFLGSMDLWKLLVHCQQYKTISMNFQKFVLLFLWGETIFKHCLITLVMPLPFVES